MSFDLLSGRTGTTGMSNQYTEATRVYLIIHHNLNLFTVTNSHTCKSTQLIKPNYPDKKLHGPDGQKLLLKNGRSLPGRRFDMFTYGRHGLRCRAI